MRSSPSMQRKALRRVALMLLAVLTVSFQCLSQTATSVGEADSVCGKCHAEIVRTYLQTPMAKASGMAQENLHSGSYRHDPSKVDYQITTENGDAWLSYTLPENLPIAGKERLAYSLGSGHLGLTYLYAKNDYWFESPVAYYSSLSGYAMKPGLAQVVEMPTLTINASCLRCHMSSIQPQDLGTENHYRRLPFLHVGISCESCHGDTRNHVSTSGHAPVINPAKLTPEKRDSICIVCHLEGDTSVERRGHVAIEFQPGDDIQDFISYFVFAGANTTKRAVSEIEQFNSSRCKLTSGPVMSCMNCHNPHASPAAKERVAFYRGKCLVCHTQEKYALSHYPSDPDCTGCHMPKTGAENIAHVAWTDHRIRQRPDQLDTTTKGADPAMQLVPILGKETRLRDLALAYYNLTVKGMASEKPRASQMVAAALQADQDDEALLRAMGILSEWNGDLDIAKRSYVALLKKDPTNLAAKTNLATLLAKSGDLQGAIQLWSQAFQINEDLPQLGSNLAIADCRLGDRAAAAEALKKVLLYNPGLRDIRQRLEEIESGQMPCTASSLGDAK